MADSETGESEVKKDSTEPTETKIESVKEEAKAQPEKKKSEKVEVRLQAAGDAPIMKQKNYNVDKEKPISWILAFIRRYLKFQSHESLYLYVNQVRSQIIFIFQLNVTHQYKTNHLVVKLIFNPTS